MQELSFAPGTTLMTAFQRAKSFRASSPLAKSIRKRVKSSLP